MWKNLVPTYEMRLTPINNIFLENIAAGSVEKVSLVNVSAKEVGADNYQNRNVKDFH
jgi:hypothetical protein